VPTYDYECTKCGHNFSVEQSMLDKPLRKCPKCGGKLEKLLPQKLSLIFKGSGFYITDYKNKQQKRPEVRSGPECRSTGGEKSRKSESDD
jgi:putative FmdB family regulatory protein